MGIRDPRIDRYIANAAPFAQPILTELPALALTDLDGHAIAAGDLAGRAVLVEFWATWCPPCRSTLGWLAELKKKHGDRLAVVAIAVESEEAAVRKLAKELGHPFRWAIGSPELGRAFGDVSAVPTLLLFGPDGKAAGTFFGAPPTLHADAEAKLAALVK